MIHDKGFNCTQDLWAKHFFDYIYSFGDISLLFIQFKINKIDSSVSVTLQSQALRHHYHQGVKLSGIIESCGVKLHGVYDTVAFSMSPQFIEKKRIGLPFLDSAL